LIAPIIVLVIAASLIISSFGSLMQGGTVNYNEEVFQDYANAQYIEAFGDSTAYEDNILIVLLVEDEEYYDYNFIAWVGDHIDRDINYMFGNEQTELGRAIRSSAIHSQKYKYSLGQGLSAAVGMCLANKLDKNDHRVYCLIGDGEAEEGQIWEAAMAAAHYKCDNLCAIIDNNGLQIDGKIEDVIGPAPFDEKFRAFGWHTINVDGHDFAQLEKAFAEAKTIKGKPTCIIAKTVKGKGVSYMENVADWHGKAPNAELTATALKDLEGE
jgi:hypothetical protein